MTCVMCLSESSVYLKLADKTYYRCPVCDLIFLDPSQRLDLAKEKARYEKHENNVLDQGYQRFVQPLFDAVMNSYKPEHVGLDYGSGPDSAVSYLLNVAGYAIQKYDPFFFNQPEVLKENSFDYVVVCEVAEHFYDPQLEFAKLKTLLKPGGRLFVMTSLMTQQIDFSNWSYRRDVTHVCFYSAATCRFIKEKFNFKSVKIENSQIIIFRN